MTHKDRADLKPNQYLLEISLPKPSRIHLLAQIHRAPVDDQQAVRIPHNNTTKSEIPKELL
ncbi:MAG TPA: hypothetical protein PKV73_12665 [Agriterribacter sp.]|nr:hypothetical protein [Agriterribacter sp.]